MQKLFRHLNNERGSIMLVTLLILSLMTILGLSASKSTITEMQISNNQMVYRQNFYDAEGAINEGMQMLEDTDLENATPGWVRPFGSVALSPATEAADVYIDATWTPPLGQASVAIPSADLMSAYRGVVPGGSLDLGGSTIYAYDVYGRDQSNNGMAVIKMAYRKAY